MNNPKNLLPTGEVCMLATGTVLEGNMKIAANIRLEGTINGNVECDGKVVMASAAVIKGNIICKDLVTEGLVTGNVLAKESVTLLGTAKINGDIECARIQIDNGALFNGKCIMHKSKD